jgi:NhaA family Na+:H+ antiporter
MNTRERSVLPNPWSRSSRLVPRRVVQPLRRFAEEEAAGGVVMLAAAVAALLWANSPWHESYVRLWDTHLAIDLGDVLHLDHLTLKDWVNDLLMALFFFVVALEIKRELVRGELRDPRAAALPALAALGGMVVPALIYVAFNAGGPGADGWGIPMATDIAFAVGVVTLAGSRIPAGAKLFLLTLAIVDDLGAIGVIAIFYTDDLSFGWLAIAGVMVAAAAVIRRVDVRSLVPYVALAAVAWVAMLESGVHATLTGVAFGLLTPAAAFFDRGNFVAVGRRLLDRIEHEAEGDNYEEEETQSSLRDLDRFATEAAAPLDRLEHLLGPWSAFVVVPIFAFANAGVRLSGETIGDAVSSPVTIGIAVGLVLGKMIGVFSFTWAAVQAGVGRLPAGVTSAHLLGVSIIAGIGFTVALFVANLSFTDPHLTDMAKIGILSASLVAGVLGYAVLRFGSRAR